jgi:hypothetical protein
VHPLEGMKFTQKQLLTPELLLALSILGGFALLVLLLAVVLYYKKREAQFRLFRYMLSGRDLSDSEIRCFFRYLKRHDIPLELILENETVAKEALEHCGIDEKEGLRKLGFDMGDLVKKFLQRQRELRKKWNSR